MATLRLLLYCIPLFYIQVGCAKSNIIQLPLYKQAPYKTLSEFKSNVDYYTKVLPFYFGQGYPDITIAKIDKNVDYIASINLGYPTQQKFSVYVDTSFSGLWIPSLQACFSSWSCYGKNFYNHDLSTEYVQDFLDNEPQTRKIVYRLDSGSMFHKVSEVKGNTGFDTLWVKGNEIAGTHFMEATGMSYDPFSGVMSDGVFGLGFPSPSLKMAPPFFTMIDRGLLGSQEFSLFVGKSYEIGEISFGGRNPQHYKKDTLQFHPINRSGYWEVNVNTIHFGAEQLCPLHCKAWIDTGTALIAAPANSLRYIYRSINLSYTGEIAEVNCANVKTLPVLKIGINGQIFTLSGLEYTIQIDEKKCVLAIMECPIDAFWILGNVFLSRVYTVFNVAEMQIGFAELNAKSLRSPDGVSLNGTA